MKAFTLLTGLAMLAGAAFAESVPAGESVFDAMDRDGDGAVSAAEYAVYQGRTAGIPAEEALATFATLSGGDGSLSPEDWAARDGETAEAAPADDAVSMDAIPDDPAELRTRDETGD